MKPRIGDTIIANWPGHMERAFEITDIRPDKDGIECAVFGMDGAVGAEAVTDLYPTSLGSWQAVPLTQRSTDLLYCYRNAWQMMAWLSEIREAGTTGIDIDTDERALAFQAWEKLAERIFEELAGRIAEADRVNNSAYIY